MIRFNRLFGPSNLVGILEMTIYPLQNATNLSSDFRRCALLYTVSETGEIERRGLGPCKVCQSDVSVSGGQKRGQVQLLDVSLPGNGFPCDESWRRQE
jgi:hypothetical protein